MSFLINPYVFAASGGDPYFSLVKLLLDFDGSNGSTTFTDLSASARTVTANGNAQVTTTNPKYGTGAGLFDGAGDYLTCTASADFQMFSGFFCLEFDAYYGSSSGNQCMVEIGSGNTDRLNVSLISNQVWVYRNVGVSSGSLITATAPSDNNWHHICLTQSTGPVLTLGLDGVSAGTNGSPGSLPAGATLSLAVGSDTPIAGGTAHYNGRIDNLRLTVSNARYSFPFTPPAAAHPTF
jgi:hypothetical protein